MNMSATFYSCFIQLPFRGARAYSGKVITIKKEKCNTYNNTHIPSFDKGLVRKVYKYCVATNNCVLEIVARS